MVLDAKELNSPRHGFLQDLCQYIPSHVGLKTLLGEGGLNGEGTSCIYLSVYYGV